MVLGSSGPNQAIVELIYATFVTFGYILARRTLNLKSGNRGMNVFYDAIDWIRGYPYEYACVKDITERMRQFGYSVVRVPTDLPCEKGRKASLFESLRARNTGCNEIVFKKD